MKNNIVEKRRRTVFTILGLRLIPNIDGGEVDPTPTAAPVERIIGALGAEYLKPINIIK